MCHLVLLLYLISYIFFGLVVCMCLYTEVSHSLFVSYSRLHVGIKEPIDRLYLFLTEASRTREFGFINKENIGSSICVTCCVKFLDFFASGVSFLTFSVRKVSPDGQPRPN